MLRPDGTRKAGTPPKHGGARIHRKIKGVDLRALHAEVAPELYAWVELIADQQQISKAEALECVLKRDMERAIRFAEKKHLQNMKSPVLTRIEVKE